MRGPLGPRYALGWNAHISIMTSHPGIGIGAGVRTAPNGIGAPANFPARYVAPDRSHLGRRQSGVRVRHCRAMFHCSYIFQQPRPGLIASDVESGHQDNVGLTRLVRQAGRLRYRPHTARKGTTGRQLAPQQDQAASPPRLYGRLSVFWFFDRRARRKY